MTEAPRRLGLCDGGNLRPLIRVTVDGDALRDVIAYDCDAGWIMFLVHDDCGCLIPDGPLFEAELRFGRVDARVVQ